MLSPTRHALNEALYRSVNEEIAGLSRGNLAAADEPGFVCECARIECTAQVRLTLAEYEQMRHHDRRYVVTRGHELDTTTERVIRFYNGFTLIEKSPLTPSR